MNVIDNIYGKLTKKRLGFTVWKYEKGDGRNKQELTQDEIKEICEKVMEHGSRSRAAEIYQHIYNVPSGTYAFNECQSKLYPDDDEDASDEEDAH